MSNDDPPTESLPSTVRQRLIDIRARDEDEACQLMRDAHGVPMSRQYLWQILFTERRGSLRLFARAVARLGIGEADCPIRASLEELFPDEFKPVNRQKLVRAEGSRRNKAA